MNRNSFNVSRNVSYSCSYVPEEIIMAAGLVPRRTVPKALPSQADAYMHPHSCCYVRSLLASAISGNALPTDGIVFANSCDAMRRLYDIWSEYVKAIPAVFIDVPKKKDAASIEFFACELRKLADKLERDFLGLEVTDERLNDAIGACNDVRLAMNEVFKLQRDRDSSVRGLSVFQLCLEGVDSQAANFAEKLNRLLPTLNRERDPGGEKRVVLTGNVVNRPDLISLIEDAGSRVVVLDTCIGVRHYDTVVKRNAPDPMLALAERYLLRAPCARMEGIEERFQYLRGLAEESRADGVIYSTVKFCDTYVYDVPLMRSSFEKAGIPFLFLENDYEWGGLEQMRTRVEAFLETASERRLSSNA